MKARQQYVVRDRSFAQRLGELVADLTIKPDKPWKVTIEPYVNKRTTPQNALYWQWLTIIGDAIGYTKDEAHDILREKFLPWEEREVMGVRIKILTSTSALDFTTAMMSEYMDHIDRFAAQELGIILPHPEDKWHESHEGRQ